MATFKNTAPGGRGVGHGGNIYACGAGEVIDIPDAVVAGCQDDPANAGAFGEGGFVPVSPTKASLPPPVAPTAPPAPPVADPAPPPPPTQEPPAKGSKK